MPEKINNYVCDICQICTPKLASFVWNDHVKVVDHPDLIFWVIDKDNNIYLCPKHTYYKYGLQIKRYIHRQIQKYRT
jgi:hypothetical protein